MFRFLDRMRSVSSSMNFLHPIIYSFNHNIHLDILFSLSLKASKISLLKYPKRKDREAWHLFQLLECCHHLGNGGTTNHGVTGKHSKQENSQRRNRSGIAAVQGGPMLVSLLVAKAESNLPTNAATLADAIGKSN